MQPEWRGELGNFLDAINPICKEEWTDKGVLGKIYLVVKVCIYNIHTCIVILCANQIQWCSETWKDIQPVFCCQNLFLYPSWAWTEYVLYRSIFCMTSMLTMIFLSCLIRNTSLGTVKLYILVRFAAALLVCSCSWQVFLLCMVIWLPTDGAINLTSEF